MDHGKRFLFSDKSIKFPMGYLEINVININYEPPVPHRYFSAHSHSSYELHYIPSGYGILKSQQKQYLITPGTFYLTGPGILHEQVADGKEPMSEYCLNFEFEIRKEKDTDISYYNRTEIDELLRRLKETNFWFGKDEFSTFHIFERLFWEIENRAFGYYTSIQCLAAQIIINASRSFSLDENARYDLPDKKHYDKRRMIIDGFFRQYDKNLKAEMLAQRLNISIRQLDRLIKEFYGMSFKRWLLYLRMEIASNLLIETDLPVEDIAYQVGFSNYSQFYKLFIKQKGLPPSKYRMARHRELEQHK